MEKAKIDRINYLARESKVRELSPEEKAEQTELRNEYRAGFRQNLMSQLDNVYIKDEKGNTKKLIKDEQ